MKALAMVVLVLAAFVGNGSALLCRNCISSSSFKECESMGDVQQCDANIVNANHAIHSGDNPTLSPGNGTAFKCYRIQISGMHPNGTVNGIRSYARGCTFNSTNFCSGWMSGLNVSSCGTCTTDNCDQNAVASTQEASTTTVEPRETTTLAPGVTTITAPEATTAAGSATTTVAPRETTTLAPGVTTTTVPKATTAKATTIVATGTTTTMAPGATTTVEPSKATTLASSETTALAQGNTTTPAAEVMKTLTPRETTTVAQGANATDKPGRATGSVKKFTIAGTELMQIATAVYVFCNIFTIVLTLFIVFAAYTIYSSIALIRHDYHK
uniref:Uncharacterized protein n=1 Tax=Anopheles atroparvus TaxID=41427 RepID=A0AAG5D1W3_ANOAO